MLGAIISGVSGLLGASAADKASNAQARAGKQQLELQREIWDYSKDLWAPTSKQGDLARNILAYEMGMGPAPTIGGSAPQVERYTIPGQTRNALSSEDRMREFHNWQTRGNNAHEGVVSFSQLMKQEYGSGGSGQTFGWRVGDREFGTEEEAQAWAKANPQGGTQWGGLSMSPYGEFRLEEGQNTIQAGAAHMGSLYSGASLKSLEDYRQGVATQDREMQMNRLRDMAGMGMTAKSGMTGAAQNFATGGSAAYGNIGDARAAGAIGKFNALSGAMDNIVGYQQMKNMLAA